MVAELDPTLGLQQEAEEAAARIGILRHDWRYPDFLAGFEASAESLADRVEVAEGFARSQSDREFELLDLLGSRDQRIRELTDELARPTFEHMEAVAKLSALRAAIDIVLEADHSYDISRRDAWQNAIAILRTARGSDGHDPFPPA